MSRQRRRKGKYGQGRPEPEGEEAEDREDEAEDAHVEQSTDRKPGGADEEKELQGEQRWTGERSKAKEGQQMHKERERPAEERPRAQEETECEASKAG